MWNCGEGEMRAERAGSVELGGGITIPSPRVWPMDAALIIWQLALQSTLCLNGLICNGRWPMGMVSWFHTFNAIHTRVLYVKCLNVMQNIICEWWMNGVSYQCKHNVKYDKSQKWCAKRISGLDFPSINWRKAYMVGTLWDILRKYCSNCLKLKIHDVLQEQCLSGSTKCDPRSLHLKHMRANDAGERWSGLGQKKKGELRARVIAARKSTKLHHFQINCTTFK